MTLWTFLAMAGGAALVLTASRAGSLPLSMAGFVALFLLSGVRNGSTYEMIPAAQQARAGAAVAAGEPAPEAAEGTARRRTTALIGLAGAIGAFGGVLVNIAFRQSFLSSGQGDAAYAAFLAAYALCAALTRAVQVRRR
ncbi:hypothetical protein [Streptomyces sp. NBC_01497]|uniref:hypothetical protein n=1 Tax=Streptomyces sp. NBC_01497 TaxID=2903885 RepID=UPI002E312827|nr:hypothetical protein [Streptomyces sp. NBC_01497]